MFKNTPEICGEVLWDNDLIVSYGETLNNKHFVDKGILTVKNIINEYRKPLSRLTSTIHRYLVGLILSKVFLEIGKTSFVPTLIEFLQIFENKLKMKALV